MKAPTKEHYLYSSMCVAEGMIEHVADNLPMTELQDEDLNMVMDTVKQGLTLARYRMLDIFKKSEEKSNVSN